MNDRKRWTAGTGIGLILWSAVLGEAWASAREGAAEVSGALAASQAPAESRNKGQLSVRLSFTPEAAAPGGLFQFEAEGKELEGADSVVLVCGGRRDRFQAFRVSGGLWRGYGALRLSEEGQARARAVLEVSSFGGAPRTMEADLGVAPREYPSSRLKVAPRFTALSAPQKRQAKEDQQAFSRAYAQDAPRPLFAENFVNPRGEAPRVTSVFGGRRIFNGRTKSRHWGLDLDGAPGDPVYAAADGVVRMRRDCFYAGGALVIGHGAGLFTSYFHLSRFHVAEGEAVKWGQRIGEVGQSGRVTGPHLHFGAKVGGVHIDPQLLLEFDFFPRPGASAEIGGTGTHPDGSREPLRGGRHPNFPLPTGGAAP